MTEQEEELGPIVEPLHLLERMRRRWRGSTEQVEMKLGEVQELCMECRWMEWLRVQV